MSVIAKMNASAVRDFGSGALIELSCVCANDLMAAYAESHEDKLFTKYSPWGEARLHLRAGVPLPLQGDQFYMMIVGPDEFPGGVPEDGKSLRREDNGALYRTKLWIQGVTDRGEGQAKTVEFMGSINDQTGVTAFNWRMAVDNPGATDQLKAGRSDYVLEVFPIVRFDRDQAIEAAHSPSGSPAAAEADAEPADA